MGGVSSSDNVEIFSDLLNQYEEQITRTNKLMVLDSPQIVIEVNKQRVEYLAKKCQKIANKLKYDDLCRVFGRRSDNLMRQIARLDGNVGKTAQSAINECKARLNIPN